VPQRMSSREARDRVVGDLKRRLVGPFEENEILTNRPGDTYHTGSLTPIGTLIDREEDDQEEGDSDPDTGSGESVMTLANLSQQSAMGISFQIAPETKCKVILEAKWAEYVLVKETRERAKTRGSAAHGLEHDEPEKSASSVKTNESSDERQGTSKEERRIGPWQRVVCSKRIEISPNSPVPEKLVENGIELRVVDRNSSHARVITFSVINARIHATFPNDNCIYQVELSAFSETDEPVFIARPPSGYINDEEFWLYEVLYRFEKELAIGHGCSVSWNRLDGCRSNRICSEWIPHVEVPKANASVLSGSRCLLLSELSDPGKLTVSCEALNELVNAYSAWITKLDLEKRDCVATFSAGNKSQVESVCESNIRECKIVRDRLAEGIQFLQSDSDAWNAFCLANEAMAASMHKSRPDIPPSWRAFQIAFILVCLPSTLKKNHELRNVLDLIWFPTGGGKTEAYLGLAAACIFYRQIVARSEDEAKGTAVLTRYTLRLLTIQQFERATRMICACEVVRKRILVEQNQGKAKTLLAFDVPITAGLFVGSGATPNKIEDAKDILSGKTENDSVTTLPLSECPWCATELQPSVQRIQNGVLVTPCPNSHCEFASGLPIAVVDEHIYLQPPTMIVGTIDKFARMAWEPRIKTIFGVDSANPPSLIIQDELHLISDALGTLAALYETAIDHLCTKSGCRPKIIGSTATIRRAAQQCQRLFNREARQFPPSGLNASDSFFYKSDMDNPGRLYIGIHAQGRSPKHTFVWTIGTVGQSAMEPTIPDAEIRDHFHTLVLYYNSLRELGGALVLAEDDIPRFLTSVVPGDVDKRRFTQLKELTGQVPSSEIKSMLKSLKKTIYDEDDLDNEPLDLVFSTNMISVGIDVDRLGVMIINGQPKTTSEYIQASSRVGRPSGSAGLVVTIYNWTRPRDRSHYERFTTYHNSFYRNVESVSVTPFAARARDKALHAVLVSMVRLLIPKLSEKSLAFEIRNSVQLQSHVRELMALIVNRCEAVDPDERDATASNLDILLRDWIDAAEHRNEKLVWDKHKSAFQNHAVLRDPNVRSSQGMWKTTHSMRDVQKPCPVRILTQNQFKKIDEE
jgi:hypothetical protein